MTTLLTPTKATRETKRALDAHHLTGVVGKVHSAWTDDHRSSVRTIVHLTTDAFADRVTVLKELGVVEVAGHDAPSARRTTATA